MNRRKFLGNFAGLGGSALLVPFWSSDDGKYLLDQLASSHHAAPEDVAQDETFWLGVRLAYTLSKDTINLNNGGVSPQPRIVQEAAIQYYKFANELPSHHLWRKIGSKRDEVRARLAALAGCDTEELAINRNATEGLETVIFGLPLQSGDEIVLSKYDYPSMINAWKQRALRDGIVLKWVDLDVPMTSEEEIVERYVAELTPRTKLVHITHLINWTGQLVPVGRIGELVQARGIEVMVDGAHSFAQIDMSINDLHCDYFATSLHKWLCAPFGTGFLYVRKEKISKLYPLFAANEPLSDNIRKFEHLGTRSLGLEIATAEAIDFHEMIGIQRKEAKLRYLKEYWTTAVEGKEGIRILTDPTLSAGMALVDVPAHSPTDLNRILMGDHNILISPVNHEKARGVRVSPHVYTKLEELDQLVKALQSLA